MDKHKRGPRLMNGQRNLLLSWLAADYSVSLILLWAKQKEEAEVDPWPSITRWTVEYYQKSRRWQLQIAQLRQQRRESAINTGLALKEERIERLKEHADQLEVIKWRPDEKGRFWNEKSWRETLDDIAKEMGHRKQVVEHSGELTVGDSLTSEERAAIRAGFLGNASAGGG